MGINSKELRTAIYRQATYQAAMRISIRDLDWCRSWTAVPPSGLGSRW
jgi:hypothetical protein